jgi:coiled-coil domain-containing protein 39
MSDHNAADDEFDHGDTLQTKQLDDYDAGVMPHEEEEEEEEDDDLDVLLPGVDDLPLFANALARELDLEVKEKESKVERHAVDVVDMRERVKVMQEHFQNVQQEVQHTNALVTSKRKEIQTESHLYQLVSRSLGRNKLESKTLIGDIEQSQDMLNQLQNNIYKANEKMDEFKMQMNWNQEDLDQWAVASRQKEEDNLALQKYTRADEIKVKELNLNVEQLNKELLENKTTLENEVTDTQAKQMELDRIADEFREAHKERQGLVAQWQETIDAMKQRDQEINQVGEKYAVAKLERVRREEKVSLQTKRMDLQRLENKEVETKSEVLARNVSKKHEEMVTGNARLLDYRNELESLKNELTSAAEGLVTKRGENANKARDIEEKRVMVERERQRYQQVKQALEESKKSTFQAEQTAKQAEAELLKAEKELAAQMQQVKVAKESLLKESQNVLNLKREESTLRSEIAGTKSAERNLDGTLAQLDKESARQQELLYNAEFQIQQIERKVARGMGQRSDEEKKALKAQIEGLEGVLREAREKKKVLSAQCRKIMNELVASKSHRELLSSKKHLLTEKIGELELANRMMDDELKKDVKSKEDLTVQNDVLRLEVRRLRGLLSLKADAVCSLENRKQQLALSLQERKEEVSVHRDVLRAELRTLQDEKHNITMDLRTRELAVDRLKSRYETACQTKGEDEGHSQSYYIIQAAQKREELRRKGDEYDSDIRKCEREIRALQTTLDHLNARNMAFRASFQKVDTSGDEGEALRKLEDRTRGLKESLFRKKKELQRLATDYEEDGRRLEQVRVHTTRVLRQQEHLQAAKQQVEEEVMTQQAQIDGLVQRTERATNVHREKVCAELGVELSLVQQQGGTLEEKAVRAEVFKDTVQNVLFTLGQLASEFPEVADGLAVRLQEAELKIPSKPAARASNTAMNVQQRGATDQ